MKHLPIKDGMEKKTRDAGGLIDHPAPRECSRRDVATSEHPTCLSQRLSSGETEIVTLDTAVQQIAEEARRERNVVTFVFWNGTADELVRGAVMTCRPNPPFLFTVEPR